MSYSTFQQNSLRLARLDVFDRFLLDVFYSGRCAVLALKLQVALKEELHLLNIQIQRNNALKQPPIALSVPESTHGE